MNIFVGGLSWDTDEEGLKEKFATIGEVKSSKIINDFETGKSRGFGFVEMVNDEDGEKAIVELNGTDLDGRALRVNKAKPREKKTFNNSEY